MRRILIVIGEYFGNWVVEVVMGVITSILIAPKVSIINDINSLDLKSICCGLLIVILAGLIIKLFGLIFVVLSEQIPINLEISVLGQIPVFSLDEKPQKFGTAVALSIKNKEYSKIKNCYVVLSKITDKINQRNIICKNDISEKRLCWKDKNSDIININKNSKAVLLVYQTVMNGSPNSWDSDFCIHGKNWKKTYELVESIYDFELEFHGELNNSIPKPRKWSGRIEINYKTSKETGATVVTKLLLIPEKRPK